MKKSRLWLPIFMAVSIILWVITLILTPGDPIAIYGDPEVFNAHLPILSYGATRILCPVIGVAMVLLFGAHAWITMGKKPAVSMIGLALFIAFFFGSNLISKIFCFRNTHLACSFQYCISQ